MHHFILLYFLILPLVLQADTIDTWEAGLQEDPQNLALCNVKLLEQVVTKKTPPRTSLDLPRMDPHDAGKFYDLLMKVDKIFEENKIPYCAIFGTLLGAIRHGGMIPWDDDIDIAIPFESKAPFESLKSTLDAAGFELFFYEPYFYKIFPKDGINLVKEDGTVLPCKYPFIDIFTVRQVHNTCYYVWYTDPNMNMLPAKDQGHGWCLYPKEFSYPFPKVAFGPMHIPIPHNAREILERDYGADWDQVAYATFNHRTETFLKKEKVKLVNREPAAYILPEP